MWLGRQLALTVITPIIRMLAHPTGTTVRAGSRAESLSAQARGTTAGDMDIMDGPMPADLWDLAAMWDVALRDVAERLGTASQDTAPSRAEASTVADSMVVDFGGAANL
jgi:hypothetical protein